MKNSTRLPIYCVSLGRAVNRRREIVKNWTAIGAKVNFHQAFDRRNLVESSHCFPIERDWKHPYKSKLRRKLTDGEIACTTSHLLLLQKILATSFEYALVIEDDTVPLMNWNALQSILLCARAEKPSAEIIHVGDCKRHSIGLRIKGDYAEFEFAPSGTYGLFLSRNGMRMILEFNQTIRSPYDHSMHAFCTDRRMIGLAKPIIGLSGSGMNSSFIETSQRGRKVANRRKFLP